MTTPTSHSLKFDQPAVYRIEIQGELDPAWITDMCNATVVHGADQEGRAVTTITGLMADQAMLMGILNAAYNFGYPLLSLETLSPSDRPATAS